MKNIFTSLSDLTGAEVEIKENYTQTEKYTHARTHAHTRMLNDEIMYICIKQNIKYAKVHAATEGYEARGATKNICIHTNKAGDGCRGIQRRAGQQACSILLATAGAGDQK